MAKTRKEKEKLVNDLKEKLNKAKSAVFVNYKGLTVSETEELRKMMRKKDADIIVIKNKLANIALKSEGIEISDEIMNKPIALAFSYQDEVEGVKEVDTFAKDHQKLEIMGGLLEKSFIDTEKVKNLASLPSRDELYAKVVGSIAAPISGLVNVLSGNIRGLINVLNKYSETRK